MNLKQRSYQKEILDQDNIPFQDIKKNMEELNIINKLLGGHKISINGLKSLLIDSKSISICEIGCGGGDNIEVLSTWCLKKNIDAKFIGVDIKDECIQFAKSKHSNGDIKWITSDYEKVNFESKPDIIFSSLFCHHFTNQQLCKQLNWMKNNSKIGFFINDLHRHKLAYYSIKFLTTIFSSSYLVKNDAPLSVARGFKAREWKNIFSEAGFTNISIKWKWAFRFLIVYRHA